MNQDDLQRVVPGFEEPVQGSQAVFRCALDALSMPGRWLDVPADAQLPPQAHGAAALLLLALLDSDCSVWLSASLKSSDAQAWLRFHTGCHIVNDPSQARFLWLAAGDTWPALAEMAPGTDTYPDQSATCVLEVSDGMTQDAEVWSLTGPGIDGTRAMAVAGLPPDFEAQWAINHAAFPRGVDVFLATPTQLLGLPRSTRLGRTETAGA
jgi:alpha-D-ribose 1-methylphosphonate 5-triphosphate synthase subunit PhnH